MGRSNKQAVAAAWFAAVGPARAGDIDRLLRRAAIGVNAAGVAGVATPQYLTCRGCPVLTTPNILTSV